MAVETPVLERRVSELTRAKNSVPFAVPTRSEYEAEEEHNARIRGNYARLMDPNNRIEDVFNQSAAPTQEPAQPVQNVQTAQAVQNVQPAQAQPYLVTNARADSPIFRADNPINQQFVADAVVVDEPAEEEENDDLRPTAATRQYRTIDVAQEEAKEVQSDRFVMTKKQKCVLVAVVAVVVALIALIIINATVIANLNTDIAQLNYDIAGINAEIQASVASISEKLSKAQSGIDTLRGATAGSNIGNSVADMLYGLVG